ncbi:cysteine-rich RLK (RECEPTOR-like protein kinase) 8 [Hibiscus trionum]|uniref:Cysteine-rich RLK (RECEPTOR-like protein kinase) 8 n=1 Tax=Hibiscus trionum TaxID=183268 RepID=A0A9W7H6D1_HIBTR|nr:cysteine-rich RLK (RECEPTOR-like protein kinase) 8 [Hibiscus trionum]
MPLSSSIMQRELLFFLVYVDDIVLTGNNIDFIAHFTNILSTKFALKDMGLHIHFLGIEAISTPTGLFLSQAQYISDILAQFQMENAKAISTPMSSSNKLPRSKPSTTLDISGYRRLLGLFQYLTLTRLNISFVMNRLSQYMHSPSLAHWTVAKCILRYLKGTLCHDIIFPSTSSLHLTTFADAD